MQIHERDLAAYVRLTAPDATDAERSQDLADLRAAIESGERNLADTRVAKSADGRLRAAFRLVPVGDATLVLVGPTLADPDADDAAAGLLPEVMDRARVLGAAEVSSRPDKTSLGPLCRTALLAYGFHDLGERIEFKRLLLELPSDEGSPLTWKGMDEVGRETAVAMFERAAADDPHGPAETHDARVTLQGYLSAPKLTNDPSCVQIGYEDGQAVAFLCAQVAPSDGWSRITYMGLVPEARGRGLGMWVHRKGFELLRAQGGRLYHGGTAAANTGMLRLFRKHGCKEVSRMLEFEWRAPISSG